MSQGRADLQFRMSLANVSSATLSIMIGLQWGIVGVALAYTVFNLLWAPISIYVVTRILRYDFVKIQSILVRNLLASFIPFAVLMGLQQYLSFDPFALIFTLVLSGGVLYLSTLLIMKRTGFVSW